MQLKPECRAEIERNRLSLVVNEKGGDGGVLGVFPFRPSSTTALRLDTDLAVLGGDLSSETWHTEGPVETGQSGSIHWSRTPQLLMATLEVPDDARQDLSEPARAAYLRLVGFLEEAGGFSLIRLWNFLPAINEGAGDEERYRRFCHGRCAALKDSGIREAELCAGTAIGTRGDRMLIHALAARTPGEPIENPRQLQAYRYPRAYGPRSPSFARATAVGLNDGSVGLLISGTASVVGHATVHPDNLEAQVDETILNMNALLETAASQLDRPALGAFGSGSLLRVYLRDGSRWGEVEPRVRRAWPGVQIVGLEGDICRADLLVEIEAWHRG